MESVEVVIRDVVGPLPDTSGIIIASAAGKTFPIKCYYADAACLWTTMSQPPEEAPPLDEGLPHPYEVMMAVLKTADVHVIRIRLVKASDSFYSVVYMVRGENCEDLRKPIKFSEQASVGAIVSVLSGVQMQIERPVLDGIIDSTEGYEMMRSSFQPLFPLMQLSSTEDMELLSNYLDAAMPNGSVFSPGRGG